MLQESFEAKPRCHIHNKVYENEIKEIRQNVCVNDSLTKHSDGKYYCLFHLPSKHKDTIKFEELFQSRLNSVKKRVAEIENLPKEKKKESEASLSYDFRYVYFPSSIDLRKYKFEVGADFTSATFAEAVDFRSSKFASYANFRAAKFSKYTNFSDAIFIQFAGFSEAIFDPDIDYKLRIFIAAVSFESVIFIDEVDFSSAIFAGHAQFYKVIFTQNVWFNNATFAKEADFTSVIFIQNAYFPSAFFLETSQAFFLETRICKMIDFQYAIFAGYVQFGGNNSENVFLDKKIVLAVKQEVKEKLEELKQILESEKISFQIPDNFERNREAILDLQNARLENPERISFHTVPLCTSWFIDVDPRKMVFTDVRWNRLKMEFNNANIIAELDNLEKRQVSEPNHLLVIVCRQLAANAEENNRFEEASSFRRMAFETEWLERRWNWFVHRFYRYTSSYGEDWRRAALGLLFILAVFALLYTRANFINCPSDKSIATSIADCEDKDKECKCQVRGLSIWEASRHSLLTATLQNAEFRKPLTGLGELFVILEKILAPLQAALLALAIRRKFMR